MPARTVHGRGDPRTARISVGNVVRYRIPAYAPAGSFWFVQSAPVEEMTDVPLARFVDDLNDATRHGWLPLLAGGLGLCAVFLVAWSTRSLQASAIAALVAGLVAATSRYLDHRRRRYRLEYELTPEVERRFDEAGRQLEALARSEHLSSIRSEHVHRDWKRHASAMVSVDSEPATLDRGYPPLVSTSLAAPPVRLRAQGKSLCFLPDRLLVEDQGRFAAIGYDELSAATDLTQMRWHSRVPGDAECVGHTWHKVNKDGSPDRRFKENRQVPILRFAELELTSPRGLQVVLLTSSPRNAATATAGIALLRSSTGSASEHAFESVRMLTTARTWADVTLPDFVDAFGRDAGVLNAPVREVLPRFLGGARDVLRAYDACTERSRSLLPADQASTFVRVMGDVRTSLLRTIASGLTTIVTELENQALGPAWTDTRTFVQSLIEAPERIVDVDVEDLRLPLTPS